MPHNEEEIKKLYKVVSDEGLYTKSFAEFEQKYNSPESIDKLYNVVSQQGLYTKSKDDFYSKYYPVFSKKKLVAFLYFQAQTICKRVFKMVLQILPHPNIHQYQGGKKNQHRRNHLI